MRLLHTADWHVGRTMRGRSRTAEFEAVLAELIEIARDEEVEALLVCGDIWDRATPSPESDRLVYEALRECVGRLERCIDALLSPGVDTGLSVLQGLEYLVAERQRRLPPRSGAPRAS